MNDTAPEKSFAKKLARSGVEGGVIGSLLLSLYYVAIEKHPYKAIGPVLAIFAIYPTLKFIFTYSLPFFAFLRRLVARGN